MALIDIRCTADPTHTAEVYRAAADWPATPPCPTCNAATEQFHPPPAARAQPDPIIVYRAPDGSFRFPGDAAAHSTGKYDRLGYERVELRGFADVRRFESQMNKRERSIMARKFERRQAAREQRESATRSELRRLMSSMTPFGRAVAREAMRRNDHKPSARTGEAGFHNDAYSNYRGNREESRDSSGRRRRD